MKKLSVSEKILINLKEKHGTEIKKTPEIERLINYVAHINYSKGYNAGKKFAEIQSLDVLDTPKKDSKPSTMLTRLVKAQELLKEKVLFIASYRDAKDNPVHGNICRYRDGLKVGEFNHIDRSDNFVVINDKRINI